MICSVYLLQLLASAIQDRGGQEAVALRVAEQYVQAFGNIAQRGTTLLLPSNTGDIASMVGQALAIFGKVSPSAALTTGSEARDAVSKQANIPSNQPPSDTQKVTK